MKSMTVGDFGSRWLERVVGNDETAKGVQMPHLHLASCGDGWILGRRMADHGEIKRTADWVVDWTCH